MTTTDDDAGTPARPDPRGGGSSRLERVRRLTRLPAPPLWLLGIIEAVQVALITVLAVLLPVMAMALADGFGAVDAGFVATLSAQVWSVMHGAPVILHVILDPGALGQGVTLPDGGWFQMLPMGLALIPVLMMGRSGARLARGAYSGQLWQGLITLVLSYAALAGAIGLVARSEAFEVHGVLTLLCAMLLAVIGALGGAYSEARSWQRLIGIDIEGRVQRWSQSMRWAGAYTWAVCRAGVVAAVAGVGLSAVLLGVQIGVHWMDIANMFQQLDPGLWGVIGLTLLHLALLPNLILWTLAYSTGAGFAMGAGTVISPVAVDVGPMPAAPILGALPGAPGPWMMLVVALPILAGAVAGWWLVREGENHLDDWFSLRISWRPVSLALSTLLLGLFTGVAAAAVMLVPLALSHVSLGVGRMTDLGPHALLAAALFGAWVAVGTMFGYLVTPAAHEVRRERRARKVSAPARPEPVPKPEETAGPDATAGPEEIPGPEEDSETLSAERPLPEPTEASVPRPRAKSARTAAPASIDEVFGSTPDR